MLLSTDEQNHRMTHVDESSNDLGLKTPPEVSVKW